jgi:hypothetical protein
MVLIPLSSDGVETDQACGFVLLVAVESVASKLGEAGLKDGAFRRSKLAPVT